MHVRVFIERRIKAGEEKKALDLILEMRRVAITQPGYVSGETLAVTDDPRTVIIVSTWHALKDWQTWEATPEHKRFASALEPLLEKSAQVSAFVNPWDALHEE